MINNYYTSFTFVVPSFKENNTAVTISETMVNELNSVLLLIFFFFSILKMIELKEKSCLVLTSHFTLS